MTISKKFFVGALVLAFAVFAAKADAAYVHTVTLKQGSTGAQVTSLQMTLNTTSCKVGSGLATGYFGSLTKAAVMCYQSSHGLTADGVVGPMTGAKLAMETGSTTSTGTGTATCPAGYVCTPTSGGSTSTGLSGGAGDVTITNTTSGTENTVAEGDTNIKVLAFKVKATGSDVAVTSAKVELWNDGTATSSERLDRYLDSVSVWQGSTKVGSADQSDFTRSAGSSDDNTDLYTGTISLSNAVVDKDQTSTFYVAVTAKDSIDTDDQDANWVAQIASVRFNDATGAILTGDTGDVDTQTFSFESASANDDLSVTASTSNPQSTNFIVKENSTSDNYLVQSFKLKSGTDANDVQIDEIPVVLTIDDASNTASSDSPDDIIDSVQLKIDGNTYDSDSNTDSVTNGDGTATYTFAFDDNEVVVPGDDSVQVDVYVKYNNQSGNYGAGTTIVSSVTGSAVTAESVSNGDAVTVTGSSTSKTHSLSLNAPSISLVGTPSLTSFFQSDTATDIYLAKFVFNVNAGDDDIYLNSNPLVNDATFPSTAAISYTVTGGATVNSVTLDPQDSSLVDNSTDYLITSGSTEQFTLSFYLQGNDSSDKVAIDGFSYGLNDTDRDLSVTSGLSNFHTSTVYLGE
ncbi:MAG TPA: peptidoglycan-binding domain-containing protein [Candidatus Paceibacterota bacterium]|nr:peptidoglycan-binding domain-containing protein [Candidatus Paceibacterota bacterium]